MFLYVSTTIREGRLTFSPQLKCSQGFRVQKIFVPHGETRNPPLCSKQLAHKRRELERRSLDELASRVAPMVVSQAVMKRVEADRERLARRLRPAYDLATDCG